MACGASKDKKSLYRDLGMCAEVESRAASAATVPDFQRASSDGARSAFGLKISRGNSGSMGAVRCSSAYLPWPSLCNCRGSFECVLAETIHSNQELD